MNKQQTAVEWLLEQCPRIQTIAAILVIEKAEQMEKQQIIDAYLSDRFPCSDEDAEQYYNETFNANHE
jgi:hypothetical protein